MDLFQTNDQDNFNPDKDYLNELVGPDKPFKTPQDLARGKAESNFFIEQLKRENAEMREELGKRRTVEQVADQLMQRSKNDESHTPNSDGNQSNPNSGDFEDEDLDTKVKSKVRALLDEERIQAREDANEQSVRERLQAVFGNKSGEELTRITQELGETKERMIRLARENPKAFFRLTGIDTATQPKAQKDSLFSPPSSAVISQNSRPTAGSNTWSYFQNMRKTDPDRYRSISVQQQIFKQAKEYANRGEDFYTT